MKQIYYNYYIKLVGNNFTKKCEVYNQAFENLRKCYNELKDRLGTNLWNELGKEEINDKRLPTMFSNILDLESNIIHSLGTVCKLIDNDLVGLLKKLKEKEDILTNTEEDKKESLKNEIYSIECEIDKKINEINNFAVKFYKELENFSNANFDNDKFSNSLPEDIRKKKSEFLGNIDNPTQYTRDPNYANMKKYPMVFNNRNGSLIDFKNMGNKIPVVYVKKGEKLVLTVKLPTNTGMINEIRRTSADGGDGFRTRKVIDAYSDMSGDIENPQYINYQHKRFPKGLNTHKNYYEWVITGNGYGDTIASQTCEYTDYDNKLLKVMCKVLVKVVDKLPEEKENNQNK